MKVIIFGAGIGGLTAAHELSKHNMDVTVYEKNNIVGGLARSKYVTYLGNKYPCEYSWRIYGSGYKNLLQILKEIPLENDKQKSVFDNLVEIYTFIFARFDKKEVILDKNHGVYKLINHLSYDDIYKIINKLIYCSSMSQERIDSYDDLSWDHFCDDLSPEGKKYFVQIWTPILGMDRARMSFPVVSRMLRIVYGVIANETAFLYLMNKPTNDAWLNEWVSYLESKNVKFKLNHELHDMNVINDKIYNVTIKNKSSIFNEKADHYVLSLSVESIASIVRNNINLQKYATLKNTINLASLCKQIQLSVQIFLNKKVVYPTKSKSVIYLPDSPWALIIEPQDVIWDDTYCTNKQVKSVWSVIICQTDVNGILIVKPFIKCTENEVRQEVMYQIIRSYYMSNIHFDDGSQISEKNIIFFYIWDTFYFNSFGFVDTSEPKFSNNIGSLKYLPNYKTEIINLFFATAYTKTTRLVYSMESAAEAGILVSNEITNIRKYIYPFEIAPHIFKPLIYLNEFFYERGLLHPSHYVNVIGLLILYLLFIVLIILVFWIY